MTADNQNGWTPIPGFEGWYEAHPNGQIRSVDRDIAIENSRTRPYSIHCRGRILRTTLNEGYPYVTLWMQHVQFTAKVANYIALTFHGPRPDGLYICHINGDRADSAASNLYYGTPSANVADALRHGTLRHGERTPWAKLTEADVRYIRSNPERLPQRALGEIFGIHQSRISKIQRREQWRHVA